MQLTRRLATAGALVTLAVTAGACGGQVGDESRGGAAGQTIKIAGVAAVASDPFWISIQCGAAAEAKRLGAEFTWTAGATADAQQQAQNLQTVMLKRPDGVLLAPFSTSTFVSPVQSLMRKGVPVVLVAGTTLDKPVHYQSFQTSASAGFAPMADLIAKQNSQGGSIGILGGTAGTNLKSARVDPMVRELAKSAPNIKPLKVEYDGIDSTKAATIVSSWILAHPDLKAVWAVTGPSAQGAAAAVEQHDKTGKVRVYAYDATPDEVAALKRGVISGLIAQSPIKQGQQAVAALVRYIKDHPDGGAVSPAKPQTVDVDSKVLTPSNVDTPEGQKYVYRTKCEA